MLNDLILNLIDGEKWSRIPEWKTNICEMT